MQGFFNKKETSSITRPDGKNFSCSSCGLYKNCENSRLEPYGNFKKHIMIIADFPGEVEDKRGKPFQGKAGRLLQTVLKRKGIDLFEDCISLYAINCYPGETQPSNYQIECCRSIKVLRAIHRYNPNVILIMGNSVLFSLLGHRWKGDLDNINKWRGFCIPDQDMKAWLIPTYNPDFVNQNEDNPVIELLWTQDIQLAIDKIDIPITKAKKAKIEIIEDLSPLNKIWDYQTIAFDYETTGLKPHAKGHRIVCASVAVSEELCYAFMMPPERNKREPFLRLLKNKMIAKIAQNMKFEHTWSLVKLQTQVEGWKFDTMLASHIIDNRTGITGLKFQVYINFGVIDYTEDVSFYLKSVDEKNANGINRIFDLIKTEAGKQKLLTYCAWDSIYEFRLAAKQKELIEYDLPF